jgi:hypothetical protein
MSALEDVLRQLARESGRGLAELGVRPGDERWIAEHAETIASLAGGKRSRRGKGSFLYWLARRAARMAR